MRKSYILPLTLLTHQTDSLLHSIDDGEAVNILTRNATEKMCTKRPLYTVIMLIMVLVLLLISPSLAQAEIQKEAISWRANWIWCEGERSPYNFYLYARKEVEIPASVEKAEFNCTADSRYQLFINGELIGRGPTRSDPRWQSYDKYEVSSYLHPGKNIIAALIHHYGEETSSYIQGRGAFLFQGEIMCANGETLTILSDNTWRILPSNAWSRDVPRISYALGFQEIYDARLTPENWAEEDFDDSQWVSAMIIGRPPMAPWTSLVPRDIPMLLEESVFPQVILAIGECQSTEDRWREVSSIAELMAKRSGNHLTLLKWKILKRCSAMMTSMPSLIHQVKMYTWCWILAEKW